MSFRMGSLFGVPVLVDPYYLVPWSLLGLLGANVGETFLRPGPGMFLLMMLFGAVFTVSLLAHEYSHVLMGKRLGVETKFVRFFLFGIVVGMVEMPRTPSGNLAVATAGPLMSLLLGSLFFAGSYLMFGTCVTTFDPEAARAAGLGATVLSLFGRLNLTIAAFNMLPAYPMDGGRVLHSVVWAWNGDPVRSERLCLYPTLLFGAAFIVFGLAWFSPMLAMIGFFLTSRSWKQLRAAPS